jgi:hypothetical protein
VNYLTSSGLPSSCFVEPLESYPYRVIRSGQGKLSLNSDAVDMLAVNPFSLILVVSHDLKTKVYQHRNTREKSGFLGT